MIRMMIDLIFAELTYLHGAEWPPLSMNHTSASDRFLFKLVKSLKKDEAEVVLLFRSELRSEFLNAVVLKIRIVGFF